MDAESFMRRAIGLKKEIVSLEKLHQRARERAILPPSSIGKEGSGGRRDYDGAMVQCANYALKLAAALKKLEEIKCETESVIELVDRAHLRILLRVRYLEEGTWEETAEAIGYESVYWVSGKLNKEAIKAVQKVLDEREEKFLKKL